MAKPPKKTLPDNFDADDVMEYGNKEFGALTVQERVDRVDTHRLPCGIFPLDFATGGGIPRGRTTEIYGPESAGKTNLLLSYMAVAQKLEPENRPAFIDQEHSLTPQWARKMGVNPDKLIYVRPQFAEQAVDLFEKLVQARGVSIVGLDSIAAMMTTVEGEKSALDPMAPGGSALVCTKFARRIPHAMDLAERAILSGARSGKLPAAVVINQIRTKIGVMYGSDEGTPGGQALKHLYGMRLRAYGKNVVDAKVNDTMPIMKAVDIIVKKWKVPILAQSAAYDIAMLPFKNFQVGDVLDWSEVSTMMKEHELLVDTIWNEKKQAMVKGGWTMCNLPFSTLKEAQAHYYKDTEFRILLHQAFIEQAIEDGHEVLFDSAKVVGKAEDED